MLQSVSVAGATATVEELHDAAAALALRLGGASCVAVEAHPTLATVVAVLGGLQAGVPVVPLAADGGAGETAHVLGDCGAPILLRTGGPALDAGGYRGDVVEVDARASAPSRTPTGAAGPALILYTSGTTGPPKGVVVSRAAVEADLDALAEAWAWTPEDTLAHGLPLNHVHGLILGVLGPLRVGSGLVHTGRPTPAAYAAAVEAGATLFFGVPTVWGRVAGDTAATRSLRRARLLVSGSAPLPRPVYDRLVDGCGQGPIERYGMTETLITLSARADGPRAPGLVGGPLPGIEARLVGEEGSPVAAGEMGSLQVRGPTLMDGYLGRPEATAESTTGDGWWKTGDAALVTDDGYRIVGRESTDLIKTGGYRVGAGEIEDALLAHPAVREAAVVGEPDDDLGQAIVAYVVADGVGGDDLTRWVADGLAAHKRPRRVELVATLPRNPMGKVQKSRLGG